MKVACPRCKSERIAGNEILQGHCTITSFSRTSEGKLEPEWGGTEIHWDTQISDPDHPYFCQDCGSELTEAQLVIEED